MPAYGIEYRGYLNSWLSEYEVHIVAPLPEAIPIGSTYLTRSKTTQTTWAQIAQDFPQVFSYGYTIFTYSQSSAEAFRNRGFTNVLVFSNGTKIYFSPRTYIELRVDPDIAQIGIDHYIDNTRFYWGISYQGTYQGLTMIGSIDGSILAMNPLGAGIHPPAPGNWEFRSRITTSIFPNITQEVAEFYSLMSYTFDPYQKGGETSTGGGGGSFSRTTTNIDYSALPTTSVTDAGFITLYAPLLSELQNLSSYLWAGAFDPSAFKKLFANPMDAILGLSSVPVNVSTSGSQTITIGNISTGISMTKCSSQYTYVDCGSITVDEFWGSYLDYDPFTKIEIYLPYIGIRPLATDDVMNKTIGVRYNIDILTGACVAQIKCAGSVLYSFTGNVATSLPITGGDFTNVVNGALSIAGSVGSLVATSGASAPSALGSISSTAVNGMKVNVAKSGSLAGNVGNMSDQIPYLIITTPRQAVPANQNQFTGYPAFITKTLSTVSGYTEIEEIHLENMTATAEEITEIETLLKTGVIF